MYKYSELFTTRYDQEHPVGHIGSGTHYSVLRASTWFDNCKLPLREPKVHDFAIIWDKDHDKRVIDIVEHMYMKNLLAPALFVGESNGVLSVLVSPNFKESSDDNDFQAYVSSVVKLAQNQYAPWTAEVSVLGETQSELQIIASSKEHADLYLKSINLLWDLGQKDFNVGLKNPDLNTEPLLAEMIV